MEESSDDIPQLTVETENIRRRSVSTSESKTNVEPILESTLEEPEVQSSESHLDVQNETNIKRIDSDSKFGHMETIPLELSGQESIPVTEDLKSSPLSCGEEDKSENLPLQMRSLSLNESNLNPKPEMPFVQRTQSVAAGDGASLNSLSKYFIQDAKKVDFGDSQGVEFFNALSSDVTVELNTSEKPESFIPIHIGEEAKMSNVQIPEKKTEVGEEVLEDTNLTLENATTKENAPTKPAPLSKFFAEDKSGTDRDGKAFFDKISEETDPIFLTCQQISAMASQQTQFLAPPTITAEIEEAWIPSESTRQTLVAMITSAPGTFSPYKKQLTMPGVIIGDEMGDPIKALLIECNSPLGPQRKALTADDVTLDEEGLKRLIETECYHSAINLTKKLLQKCGQGLGDEGHQTRHTPLSLRLWYTRLALLVKLKKFSFAEVESAAFGDFDRPDLYYEFYPDVYSGKKGTMVPFSFRILLAELPQYQGNHQVALDNLYRILNIIQKMIWNLQNGHAEDGSMIELSESRRNASITLWSSRERRVLYSVLNCVLSLKDYVLAVSIINILIEKDIEHASELHSALGRIYLQLGDVKYAQTYFTKAATLSQEKSGDVNAQVEDNINKALLAIALDNNEEAYRYYQQAYALCPENPMLANNMAVCLLYMGRLKESVSLLEKTIQCKPSSCLHDGILFNICTLYELESSRCTQKKLSMLDLVSKHVGDGFNISCLKIQPPSK